ncbi:hypothetical protein I551_8382 [Mycobacterium ulcerans str. Harvey]|uniref:Uncharacterized protein n=1 Tax=Mycobacterium ulcerans str. Harvey TaxID=1299332 RepID=A0ABN0QKM4_MYCUL|nr:hypothetical protein I551_8382 [Mycobacterium ulcerans str. Harvey]
MGQGGDHPPSPAARPGARVACQTDLTSAFGVLRRRYPSCRAGRRWPRWASALVAVGGSRGVSSTPVGTRELVSVSDVSGNPGG